MTGVDPRSNNNSGYIVLELLLVIFISSQIWISGFYLIHKILQTHQLSLARSSDFEEHQLIVASMRNSYQQRYMNPFSKKPWLIIQTGTGDEWFPLKRLEIATLSGGEIMNWLYESTDLHTIYINTGSHVYFAGESPGPLEIKFPQSRAAQFREGIAIGGN